MADTIHGLYWSLERYCPYRTDQRSQEPRATIEKLALLRSYSYALADGKVIGDACITSWSYCKDWSGPHGYSISEKFASLGGLDAAKATCGSCEANAWRDPSGKLAGCCGFLRTGPSTELESSIASAIQRQGLEGEMDKAFVRTSPRWYGFWIYSPLGRTQCELLLKVITHVLDPSDEDRRFWLALKIAAEYGLPLHAAINPHGHTDFGHHTIFPHCPRCKAHSGLEWERPYPTELRKCRVCGHDYNPSETASSTKYHSESDPRLDEVLSPEEMRAVAERISWKPMFGASEGLLGELSRRAQTKWEESSRPAIQKRASRWLSWFRRKR